MIGIQSSTILSFGPKSSVDFLYELLPLKADF